MILPRPDPLFEWRDAPCGPALVCALLEGVATHFFTTRSWALGHRNGPSDAPWTDIGRAFNPHSAIVRVRQVHGKTAVVADDLDESGTTEPPAADIILSGSASRAIAVQAADCVPLLVADRRLG